MSITVKRQTKWLRIFAPLTIKINKRTYARLWNKEEVQLELREPQNCLSVRGSFGSKIKVKNDDTILVEDNPINAISFWGGLALILFGQFLFTPGGWIMAILTWIGLLGIISSLFIRRFNVKKL